MIELRASVILISICHFRNKRKIYWYISHLPDLSQSMKVHHTSNSVTRLSLKRFVYICIFHLAKGRTGDNVSWKSFINVIIVNFQQ